jgi:hypothetical protein
LYGAFVWARRALNSQKRRFVARAVAFFDRHVKGERGREGFLAANHFGQAVAHESKNL